MKSIIPTFAIAAMTFLGLAPELQARDHHHDSRVYISGYRSCGTPVYSERYFIGYDHCGEPVWGVRPSRQECRPVVRERYIAPCPPPRYRSDRYIHDERRYDDRCDSGRRIVIEGFFGR